MLHESLFEGDPIRIRYRADLRDTAGNPAHAATFIRSREIILDPESKKKPRQHRRILLHEYFHFVWVRLGNPRRAAWEALLKSEWETRARGEAGWSAEWRKKNLSAARCCRPHALLARILLRKLLRYRRVCIFAANPDRSEVTLSPTRLRARTAWFPKRFPSQTFAI